MMASAGRVASRVLQDLYHPRETQECTGCMQRWCSLKLSQLQDAAKAPLLYNSAELENSMQIVHVMSRSPRLISKSS